MPAKSLLKLATEACIANIRSIDDVGDAPYDIIKPVLQKIENPQKLREIELSSPQIALASSELWLAFIKRDIRAWQTKLVEPKNPASWSKVYSRLRKQAEEETHRQEATLLAALNRQTTHKQNNQMQYIDKVIDPQKKGLKAPWSGTGPRTANSALLHFGGGSRTKTNTGKGLLDRARREAREASLFSARRSVLSTPTHRLAENMAHGRVVKPGSMGATASTAERLRDANVARAGSSTAPPGSASVSKFVVPATSSSGRTASPVGTQAPTFKRPAASVFLPAKRRKV